MENLELQADEKPGRFHRLFLISSLAALFALISVWTYALIRPAKVVVEQLGMTEPSWTDTAVQSASSVLSVILPVTAMVLLLIGWSVMSCANCRKMLRWATINWITAVLIFGYYFLAVQLPLMKLQRALESGL
jgi:heme/copper-type cytochrome/quinol oxidase subunit 3